MGDWRRMRGILSEDMNDTFDVPGDDMPCNESECSLKKIHVQGVVHKVRFETVDTHPFSGIFKSGADYGLMRMSTASPYTHLMKKLTPGMALKFLRDGVDSANTVAMNSVDA